MDLTFCVSGNALESEMPPEFEQRCVAERKGG